MGAYAPAALKGIFAFVKPHISSAKDGGTLANKSGYHNSRNRLLASSSWRNDYSIQDARDKRGDADSAAAADVTMSDVDMRKATARLVAAMRARDPRVIGKLREFGGTLDSKKVTAYRVEDQKAISFDSSHLWHVHLSVFREHATNAEVCQGIAEVVAGVSATPYVWDGKSFPGAERLRLGAEGPWVTWMGEHLVVHGWTGYTRGPGSTLTTVDIAAVKWAQEKQGFTGEDADGIAGPTTWAWLAADPIVTPEPSHPVLYPEPKTKDVWQEKLVAGQKDSDSVWQLQNALRKLGFDCVLTGAYDAQTIEAVKRYQASLDDKVQDGLVGPLQTARVFKDAGVDVRIIPVEIPKPPTKPDPEVPPVTKHTITAAFFNVLRRTDPDKTRKRWPQRIDNIIKHIKSVNPDVLLANELDSVTAKDIATRLGSEWRYQRLKGIGVFWRSTVFDFAEGKNVERLFSTKDNRYVLSVPVVHKASGQTIWLDTSHLENDGDPKTNGAAVRTVQAREIVAQTKGGKRIFGSDLNSTSLTSSTNASKPRVILRAGGWSMLTDQKGVTNREFASHHGGKGSTPKGPWIDDMGFKGFEFVRGGLVRTDVTDASDHHLLWMEIAA